MKLGPDRTTSFAMMLGVALLACPVHAGEWTALGPAPIEPGPGILDPNTGRVSAVVASPTDDDKIFIAGASGGVWRTLDGGFTWSPLTAQMPAAAIGALAMDPADENTIYAGTGEANFANHCLYGLGIYKTTDGGETWAHLAEDVFGGRTFSRLIVSHADSQVLYAAVTHAGGFPARNAAKGHPGEDGAVGMFKSQDGGVSWTHLTNGIPGEAGSDVAMDPANADILYGAIGDVFGGSGNGIYKSTDGGSSWTQLGGGLPTTGVGRITLAVAPTMPQRIFTIITYPTNSSGGGATTHGVYRSDNGGTSWVNTNAGNFQATYGWYLSTAIVDPTDPDIVIVGGFTLLRSLNAGGSWTQITPQHVDMHGLGYTANGQLISGDDGGIHISPNNGNTWFPRNDTLNIVQFYGGISLHPTDETFILGGTQDNGTNRREEGMVWTHRLGGDGGHTALHHDTPSVMFAEFQGTGNLYRSIDDGDSFELSRDGIILGDRNCFMPPIVYDPTNSSRLLYGTHRVYESTNGGTLWSVISGDLTGGSPAAIRALVIAPSNPLTVYAATNDHRVLVSQDGGSTWDLKLTDATGWPRVTREIGIDPLDDGVAYLAGARFGVDQIRRTTDWGDTWEAIDGDLPDVPANTVAVARTGDGSTILLGTDRGVYVSYTDGAFWGKLGSNMPNCPVIDLRVDRTFMRVVAATLGRGVWQIALPLPDDANGDGDVDLADYAALQNCFSGPGAEPDFVMPAQTCLDTFDLDFDDDIDTADFAGFDDRLTGNTCVSAAVVGSPMSQAVCVGQYLALSVDAVGDEPFSYQWYHDGQPIDGATGRALLIGSFAEGDVGTYFVDVVNVCGSDASQEATITLCSALLFDDNFETDQGWTVINDPGMRAGRFERGEPIETQTDTAIVQPGEDNPNGTGTLCYVTGRLGGEPEYFDVDGGPTTLYSPVLDLSGYTGLRLKYAYWFFRDNDDGDDALEVAISDDAGQSWTVAFTHSLSASLWREFIIAIDPLVTPTDQMQLRFSIEDAAGETLLEALVDDVRIIAIE